LSINLLWRLRWFHQLGLVSLCGLISDISLVGFIGHNGLVGFIGLGFVSLIGFICLFGHIGLVSRIVHNCLAGVIGLSLVSLVGLSIYWPFKLLTHGVAIKLTSATEIAKTRLQQCMHAANGVTTVSSATKITNDAIWYYCAASHGFLRESWLWHVLLPTNRLDSLFSGDALQIAKQFFSTRLPQMMKYCIMRECENIIRGYLYVSDLAFVILKEIYGFQFPKRFLEISSRDVSSSFLNPNHLKT
jgi:hypothetical protein